MNKILISALTVILMTGCSTTKKITDREVASEKKSEPALKVILVSEKPVWGRDLVDWLIGICQICSQKNI